MLIWYNQFLHCLFNRKMKMAMRKDTISLISSIGFVPLRWRKSIFYLLWTHDAQLTWLSQLERRANAISVFSLRHRIKKIIFWPYSVSFKRICRSKYLLCKKQNQSLLKTNMAELKISATSVNFSANPTAGTGGDQPNKQSKWLHGELLCTGRVMGPEAIKLFRLSLWGCSFHLQT